MGHLSHHKAYGDLQQRIEQLPTGLPDTPEALAILRLLFSPEEAALVARMPFRPSSASAIARRVGRSLAEVTACLERMADRGLIFDLHDEKRQRMRYCVAPPVVGFIEFSLMRRRQDIDQRQLAHALEDLAESGSWWRDGTIFAGETQIGRTLVHEETLAPQDAAELLTYERASAVIEEAETLAVSLCYCRHKAEHLGHACNAPLENCLSLGIGATYVLRHQLGREIAAEEAQEILVRSREAGLVFIADNVQRNVSYLCSCCGCCCGQLQAINRYGLPGAVKTSSFLPVIESARCRGCGRCARRCPVQAIGLTARPPHRTQGKRLLAAVDESVCLGCGLCQLACKHDALRLERRGQRVLTPEGTLQRILAQALEHGKLQNLLFDDEAGLHLLFLNRLVGAALALPPVKRALLSEGLKSRFLALLARQPARELPRAAR